ncbi:MAG: hypothetical protein ACYTEQ_12435 [Planctomycetota bacterium]|jgi:hypothetical protein
MPERSHMVEQDKPQDKKDDSVKKRPLLRKAIIAVLCLVILTCALAAALLVNNNVSCAGDQAFAKRLDTAIADCLFWTETHRQTILKRKNVALITMLKEIEGLKPTPVISDIIRDFMAAPARPKCWKRLVDPNWPVDDVELNMTMDKESLDNKWSLYAMAPDSVKVTGQELGLFDPRRWHGRKLTHQLDALIILRNLQGADDKLDRLIERLCGRLGAQLVFDVAVVDIYIQKVTFVLRAGFPEKIRRRWVERIIANQQPDGGWNDRWFYLTSDRRRPVIGPSPPPSNQHATLQALTALYLVRYKYPQHFRLK